MNLRRLHFVQTSLDDISNYLPVLDMDDLYIFSKGSYQLKYCGTYFADARNRLNPNGFVYQVHQNSDLLDLEPLFNTLDEPILMRTKILSYHSEHKTYTAYILVYLAKSGIERVAEHYCNCTAGMRTMGSCSHILAMLWFGTIGWRNPITPLKHLNEFAKRLSARLTDNDTASDEE